MDEKVTASAKKLLSLIGTTRDYSNPRAFIELGGACDEIMREMVYLVGPLMDAETAYRDEIRLLMESDVSVAKAEAMAKAGVNYNEWQKLKLVYELAEQQIMLLKKFGSKMEGEYRNTR